MCRADSVLLASTRRVRAWKRANHVGTAQVSRRWARPRACRASRVGFRTFLAWPSVTSARLGLRRRVPMRPVVRLARQARLRSTGQRARCARSASSMSHRTTRSASCVLLARTGPVVKLTECVLCRAGTRQGQQGQPVCTECPLGRFAGSPGATACTECVAGAVASTRGRLNRTECPPGSIAVAGRVCQACPVGTASADPTDAVCADCPAGRVAGDAGNSECTACPAGRFIGRPSGASCIACEQGKFANTTGSTGCTACPLNFVASVEGSEQCTECDPLRFTRQVSQSVFPSGGYMQFEPAYPSGQYRQIKDCVDCPAGASCNGLGAAVAEDDIWVVRAADGRVSSSRCLPGRCEQCPDDETSGSMRKQRSSSVLLGPACTCR